jgi:magnesium transporter
MISIFSKTNKNDNLTTLVNFEKGAWVNLTEPSDEEIDQIVAMLGVDKGLLTDALDIYEMPRLEVEDGIVYIYVRIPEGRNEYMMTRPLLFAIGPDFILTACSKKINLLDNYLSGKKEIITSQPINFFWQLFFDINAKYNSYLIDINKRLRSVKVRLEKVNTKDLVQFVDFEQVLNDFLSAFIPTDAALQKIITGRYIKIQEEDMDLVEDISLGNKQLIELTKSSLRYTINIRETYSNIATHNLNRFMKILTVLTILMTIPNVIFGFFGMNVPIISADSGHAYLFIIFSTLVFLLLLLYIFIREKWL